MHLLTAGLPSPFVHLSIKAVAPYCAGPLTMMMHRLGGWVALRPRGPRSGPGYAVPVRRCLTGPIRPTRRHIATSPQGGLYAMPSLCGSAEATREWFRAFTTIPSRHAVLSDPGEFAHRMCPVARRRRGLRRDLNGSALPTLPQSVSRGARLSRLHWFALATACQVARPPGRIGPSFPGPPGAFTSRLPAGRSPFPPLDMTTTDGVMGLAWMSCAVRWSSPDRMEVRGYGVHQPQASRDGGRLWSIMPVWTCP